jgi:hypothetical protein
MYVMHDDSSAHSIAQCLGHDDEYNHVMHDEFTYVAYKYTMRDYEKLYVMHDLKHSSKL